MKKNKTAKDILKNYLRPYQRRFIRDESRKKICLKSRRIGISEAVSIEALLEAVSNHRRDVYLCSTSLRDAKELLRYVSKWIEALEKVGHDIPVKDELATKITFKNNSRIIAIPAKNVRGRTGTIILDEFAFYQHDKEIWKGVRPAIESDKNLRLIIISTPFGASGVFHEVWTDPDGIYSDWSRHKIDVYDAAGEDFPVNPEELSKEYASDIWDQEFCCKFLSGVNQYFSHDLIRKCQVDPETMDQKGFELFGGVDLASTRDRSCLSKLYMKDSSGLQQFRVPEVATIKEAGHSKDYTLQKQDIIDELNHEDFMGVAVDAVGEGKNLGQDLRNQFGNKINNISSGDWKKVYDYVPKMKAAMEDGRFLLSNNPRIRNAFSKIQRKESTSSKRVKYIAKRDNEGHADEFSAILLSFYCAMKDKEKYKEDSKTLGSLPSRIKKDLFGSI